MTLIVLCNRLIISPSYKTKHQFVGLMMNPFNNRFVPSSILRVNEKRNGLLRIRASPEAQVLRKISGIPDGPLHLDHFIGALEKDVKKLLTV